MNNNIEKLKESLKKLNSNSTKNLCFNLMSKLLSLKLENIIEEKDFSFFIDVVEWELGLCNINKYKLMKYSDS